MADKEFKVIISVEDGQAKVKIEGLTDALNKNSAASKQAAGSTNELGKANKDLKEPLEGTIGALERENRELLKQIKNQTTSAAEGAKLASKYRSNAVEIRKMTDAMGLNNKVNADMISNTGLAGATLTEFGRAVSDAPYGIQGMANNISQLSSLFVTFTSKTGGVKKAFDQLIDTFIGPIGVTIALQAAIALWEAFSKKQKKAEESTKELNEALRSQNTILKEYLTIIGDQNEEEEKRRQALEAIKQVDKDLYEALKKNINDNTKFNEIIQKRNDLTDARIAAEEKAGEIGKKLSDIDKERTELEKTIATQKAQVGDLTVSEISSNQSLLQVYLDLQVNLRAYNELEAKKIKTQDEARVAQSELTVAQDAYNESIKETNELTTQQLEARERLEKDLLKAQLAAIEAKQYVTEKEGIDQVNEALKIKKKLLDIEEDAILKKAEKDEVGEENLNLIRARFSAERELLEITTSQEIIGIKQKFNKETGDDLLQFNKTTLEQEEEAVKKRIKLAKWAMGQLQEGAKATQAEMDAFFASLGFTGETETPTKKKKEPTKEDRLRAAQETINAVSDAFNAAYDADISREEAKTAKLNNELKKRLANENLTAKQREAINAQIEANEVALQAKRDKLAERNFKAQKAVSVANAIMSTYEAADKAMTKLPPPFSFAAAAATIVAGLANVKAILSQQFVPSAADTPSIGSAPTAPTQIQPPQFNIVGASNVNQLAEAIQAQSDKPIKTYVVSKDISTAQELDRNKVLSSGL